jgi:hypothetical protein
MASGRPLDLNKAQGPGSAGRGKAKERAPTDEGRGSGLTTFARGSQCSPLAQQNLCWVVLYRAGLGDGRGHRQRPRANRGALSGVTLHAPLTEITGRSRKWFRPVGTGHITPWGLAPIGIDRGERASHPAGMGRFCRRAPRLRSLAVDFTDFDESDTGPEGNIARFEEAA